MASEDAVEAAQLRGTNAAKVSPGTGTLQTAHWDQCRQMTLCIVSKEECEKVTWSMNFL